MIVVTYFNAAPDGFDFDEFLEFGDDLIPSQSDSEIVGTDPNTGLSIAFIGMFSDLGTADASGTISEIEARDETATLASITGLEFDLFEVLNSPATLDDLATSITFRGSANDDVFAADRQDDVLRGFGGDDILTGFEGADVIDGGGEGAGGDTVDYSIENGGGALDINLKNGTGVDSFGDTDTLTRVENVVAGRGDDRLTGNNDDNFLEGGGGGDIINARAGDDTLRGGTGDDRLNGGRGDDLGIGGAGADTIGGRSGADFLDGGSGADRVRGQGDDDTLFGGGGADVVNGGGGDDVMDGGGGRDDLKGGAGADVLLGGGGADRLNGGGGDDILTGGRGGDVLIGGGGDDIFAYDRANFGRDEILGFNVADDVIEISTSVAAEFDDLTIRQRGDDARASFGQGSITFVDQDADALTAAIFDFV